MPPPFDEVVKVLVGDIATVPVQEVKLTLFYRRTNKSELLIISSVMLATITPFGGELEQDSFNLFNATSYVLSLVALNMQAMDLPSCG